MGLSTIRSIIWIEALRFVAPAARALVGGGVALSTGLRPRLRCVAALRGLEDIVSPRCAGYEVRRYSELLDRLQPQFDGCVDG